MEPRQRFEVVPLTISEYLHHAALDGVEAEARAVLEAFAVLGGAGHVGPTTADHGLGGMAKLLADWAQPPGRRSSALVWIGHGESDGDQAWLCAGDSQPDTAGTGVQPHMMAAHVADEWRRRASDTTWAMVVVQACGAATFVQHLVGEVTRLCRPRRLLLVAVGDEGAAPLGAFSRALTGTVRSYTDNDVEVRLEEFAGRLGRYLGAAGWMNGFELSEADPLHLSRVLPTAVTATMDVYTELRAFLAKLPPDERQHYIPKAQGAEHGELAWYFVGRSAERRTIAAWLRDHRSGMLVITGRAGSGKSALLGNVLSNSNPRLRELLVRAGHLAGADPGTQPPEHVFDVAVLLTGLTARALVRRLGEAGGLGTPPAGAEFSGQVQWLLAGLRDRPFALLADALDEAQEPTVIASSVLRGIAALPRGRVVIGTRASRLDGPDEPTSTDEGLLEALGGRGTTTVRVERDPAALAQYVRMRLSAIDDVPAGGVSVSELADLLAGIDRQFLFARLAVHEVLARPRLLAPDSRTELEALLFGDHRTLFSAAVDRLAAQSDTARPLLEALALAHGRGIPRADRIWTVAATALHPAGRQVNEEDIDDLLQRAAPYIMLDVDHGQSVYRLAHRTFRESFLTDPASVSRRHRLIAAALLREARAVVPETPSPYLVHHLAGHVARADAWPELARDPDVLDWLSPEAVAAELLLDAFGRTDLPPAVAATLGARDLLAGSRPSDRHVVREIAMARHGLDRQGSLPGGDFSPWHLAWARLRREPLHITLTGHRRGVSTVAQVTLPDRRVLVASGGADRTVRLWDPLSGLPVGEPLLGHTGAVTAMTPLPLPGGRVVLATGGSDGTVRLWDPTNGTAAGPPLPGNQHVSAMTPVTLRDGRMLLAVGDSHGAVHLWDPVTGTATGDPWRGHGNSVSAMTQVTLPDGRTPLVTGSADRTLRFWDLDADTEVCRPLSGHQGAITAVAHVVHDGRNMLVSTGDDNVVRCWDLDPPGPADQRWSLPRSWGSALLVALPGRGLPLVVTRTGVLRRRNPRTGEVTDGRLTGHTGPVSAAAAIVLSDGRTLLATTGDDSTVRLWQPFTAAGGDPYTVSADCQEISDWAGDVLAATAVRLPDGTGLLATGSAAGRTVLWDPVTRADGREVAATSHQRVRSVAAADGLLASGHDHAVRVQDLVSARPYGRPVADPLSWLSAMTIVPLPHGGTMIATGGDDGTVRRWDPVSGVLLGTPMTGHQGTVTQLAAVTFPDGGVVLATGADDGDVRLWDAVTGDAVGKLTGGHGRGVSAMTAVPVGESLVYLATGDGDGVVRLWDLSTETMPGPVLTAHRGAVTGIAAVSRRDGRVLLATCGADGTLRLWDAGDGRPLHTFPLGFTPLAVAAAADWVAVGGPTGLVVLRRRSAS